MAKLKTKVLLKKGKKPIKFKQGGMHQTLHVPMSRSITPHMMEEAMSGKRGKKAKKQALFKKNVLTGRKKK